MNLEHLDWAARERFLQAALRRDGLTLIVAVPSGSGLWLSCIAQNRAGGQRLVNVSDGPDGRGRVNGLGAEATAF